MERQARDDDVVGPSRLQGMSRKWLHVQCCSLASVGFGIDTRTKSATTKYYSLHLGRSVPVLLNDGRSSQAAKQMPPFHRASPHPLP